MVLIWLAYSLYTERKVPGKSNNQDMNESDPRSDMHYLGSGFI